MYRGGAALSAVTFTAKLRNFVSSRFCLTRKMLGSVFLRVSGGVINDTATKNIAQATNIINEGNMKLSQSGHKLAGQLNALEMPLNMHTGVPNQSRSSAAFAVACPGRIHPDSQKLTGGNG